MVDTHLIHKLKPKEIVHALMSDSLQARKWNKKAKHLLSFVKLLWHWLVMNHMQTLYEGQNTKPHQLLSEPFHKFTISR